jgi:tetratricopeptide (TPR) repeat protein
MQVIPSSKPAKFAALLLVMAGVALLTFWTVKTCLAEHAGQKPALSSLERAARLDPNNSDYQLRLGRSYEYDPTSMDPAQALKHLERALELNPYDPETWLELGAAHEFEGQTAEAEACLGRADFLAPNLPPIQWSIGNFFLLHGNVDQAFRHFKVVLDGSTRYNQILFDTAWKASGDGPKILRELIPQRSGAEFDYLAYLLSRHNFEDAQALWKRVVGSSESFRAAQAAPYVDALMAAHRPAEAEQVWDDLRSRRLIAPTYAPTSKNLALNGDFEEAPLNFGFDWRLAPTAGAYATLDSTTFHSPGHSLLIQFAGNANVFYRNLFQYVRVAPRHTYRLQGFMKTEGITTDSGPRLEVRDAYDPGALDRVSDDLKGDTPWTLVTLDFTTGQKTEMVAVSVTRLPSRKFDNLIAGKVWVDDVTLAPSLP